MTKRLPTITQDEWRDAYQQAREATANKSDPSKGKTAKEWAEQFSQWDGTLIGEQAARTRIRKFVATGHMIADTDWRPFEGAMRRTAVYRFATKKGGKRE